MLRFVNNHRVALSWLVTALMICGLLIMGHKISDMQLEHERISVALDDAYLRVALAVAASPHAIIMSGDGLKIKLCNPAAEQLTGYSNDDLLGSCLLKLTAHDPDTTARAHKKYKTAIEEVKQATDRQVIYQEPEKLTLLKKDGETVDCRVAVGAIKYGGSIELVLVAIPEAHFSAGAPIKHPHYQLPTLGRQRHVQQLLQK